MQPDPRPPVQTRVEKAAERILLKNGHVCLIDVFGGLGWLASSTVDLWRQGRVEFLEGGIQVGHEKLARAVETFHVWAAARGLTATEDEYVAGTRDRHALRFTSSGDPELERRYKTRYLTPDLPERKRARIAEKTSKPPDLKVFEPHREWKCDTCGSAEGYLFLERETALCVACADLDHLVFLPAGSATLSRRAKAASRLSAIVLRFNKRLGRYARLGVLVEPEALERAEEQCLGDAEARERRRLRDEERRLREDVAFTEQFRQAILRLFPSCPSEEARSVARHTTVRSSGRVGRSAAGQAMDDNAVALAVAAHIRHRHTRYDDLLMSGLDRASARAEVRDAVQAVLDRWRQALG